LFPSPKCNVVYTRHTRRTLHNDGSGISIRGDDIKDRIELFKKLADDGFYITFDTN
jgi:hypothetical protein